MTFTGFTCSIELVPAGPQTSLNYYNIISAPEPNVFTFMENAFTWDVWEAGGDITDPCVEVMSSPASGIDSISLHRLSGEIFLFMGRNLQLWLKL